MLIGLDLDGTLLDSRLRHVVALQQAAATFAMPVSDDNAQAYLRLKRDGNNGVEALRQLGIPRAENISRRWVEIIESEEMLALDRLYPDTLEVLNRQRARGDMFVLATGRQNPAAARRQIARLGLEEFFCGITVVDPLDRSRTKAAATCHHDFNLIVGDTEVDLEWATDLEKSFHASGYGFRTQSFWARRQITSYANLIEIFDAIEIAREYPDQLVAGEIELTDKAGKVLG